MGSFVSTSFNFSKPPTKEAIFQQALDNSLSEAIQGDNDQIIQTLLESGANPLSTFNTSNSPHPHSRYYPNRISKICSPILHIVAIQNNIPRFQIVHSYVNNQDNLNLLLFLLNDIKLGEDDVSTHYYYYGRNILQICEYILGKDPSSLGNLHTPTLLSLASKYDNVNLLKILISNNCNYQFSNGILLSTAIENNATQTATYLINETNILDSPGLHLESVMKSLVQKKKHDLIIACIDHFNPSLSIETPV
jgi:ankyrin repeat protein